MSEFQQIVQKLLQYTNYSTNQKQSNFLRNRRMKKLLELTGTDLQLVKYIHVAGTNGKGTVANMIASCLQATQVKIGLFTSPHLYSFRERFHINSRQISEVDFISTFNTINDAVVFLSKQKSYGQFSLFELLTLMCFKYFVDQKVDIAVIEVGIGGLLDATNIISESVSVITSIGFDHETILGHSIADISFQKAGIIKQNSLVVYTCKNEISSAIINTQAQLMKSHFVNTNDAKVAVKKEAKELGEPLELSFQYNEYEGFMKLPYSSTNLISNLKTALTTVILVAPIFGLKLNFDRVMHIINNFYLLGRERTYVYKERIKVHIDGAHNQDAAQALKRTIHTFYETDEIAIICGFNYGHKYSETFRVISTIGNIIYFCKSRHPLAVTKDDLVNLDSKIKFFRNINKIAKNLDSQLTDKHKIVVVCGSLFVCAEFEQLLMDNLNYKLVERNKIK